MTTQATPESSTELDITGMTCAACANRIERKLNKVPGVTATVNYATEKAKVSHGGDVATDDLVAVVESAGYGARLPAPPATAGAEPVSRRRPGAAPAPAAARLARPDRAGGGDGDGPRPAVHQLAVALAHPGRAGRGVGCAPVPPCRVGQPAARQLDDGHPDLDGHARGLRLVALRPVLRYGGRTRHDPPVRADRPAQRRGGQHLPRSGCGCHHVHPRRAVLRGPVEAAGGCGHARPARAGLQGRRAAPGRRRDAGADRAARGGRPVRRTPRGEGGHRRRGRGRFLRRRRLDAHRGVGAGRGGRRGHRRRRDRQRRRASRRTRHPGRRGHPARPDGPAGRGRPERQGRGPAAGRPDLGRVRAGRDRAVGGHPRLLDRHGRGPHAGVHRRGRGADHRLPLRARTGHADRPDGRHRPGRPARHPDQGTRGARAHARGRHRAARQDRHGHHRPDGPARRRRRGR